MLNRQKWDAARFHEALAVLVGAARGDHVLDLGCGRGASLGALLDAVGEDGKVFGLDRMDGALAQAAQRHPEAVEKGRLVTVQSEVLAPPFPNDTFDAVVCQNVVECVDDREALVAQAHRILKPGGRLLLGHHDFDGIVIASDDRDLTGRLVHGYADYKQDWQEASEGRMGRMIPGLVSGAGFPSVEIETRLFVDIDLDEGSYARDYLASLVDLAPAIGVGRDEARCWAARLETAAAEGRFFFGLPWVAAICRKAAI